MPRYFFHFVWPDEAYADTKGIEFEGLRPAYWHAIGLMRRVRHDFPGAGNDWLIEVGDEFGGKPLVVLSTAVIHPGSMRPRLADKFTDRSTF